MNEWSNPPSKSFIVIWRRPRIGRLLEAAEAPSRIKRVTTKRRADTSINPGVMLLLRLMKHTLFITVLVCFALLSGCSLWASETSFFSNFSVRQLVERNRSSAGLNCDPIGGGGGAGIGSRAGGFGSGGRHFTSHRSDSFTCRLQSNEAFDEGRLFAALKLDVERTLRDTGAQITQTGSSGAANFYFAYGLKNVSGRVELSGTKVGNGYYDVRANLNETGN